MIEETFCWLDQCILEDIPTGHVVDVPHRDSWVYAIAMTSIVAGQKAECGIGRQQLMSSQLNALSVYHQVNHVQHSSDEV